jgi:hypothetical protein
MAPLGDKNKSKFNRREIAYWLDAQQHDACDRGSLSRKNGQFFALRERLMRLSDEEFDTAMRAMEGIVNSLSGTGSPSEVGQKPMNANDLREFTDLAAKSTTSSSGPSAKPVSRV